MASISVISETEPADRESRGRRTQSSPLRVLIVEDQERDARLLVRTLARGDFDVAWERVDSAADMRDALHSKTWDVILSDYSMPGFGGLEALALYAESHLDCPFIIVSGNVGEEMAVECMRAGAHDYVMKDRLTRLCEAVRRELRETEVRRERSQAQEALRESEAHFRQLWEHVETGVMLVDAETRQIIDVNDMAAEMIGAPRSAIVGHRCHAFVCPAEQDSCPVLDLGQSVHRSERVLVQANNARIPIMKSVTTLDQNGRTVLLESFVDISDLKQSEERQALHARILGILNRRNERQTVLRDLLEQVRTHTGFDAVGIRLRNGDDFPYYEYSGFSEEFILKESHLCACDGNGNTIRDAAGAPLLDCICGSVIQGRTDSSLPFVTEGGSFWTNSTTRLQEETARAGWPSRMRNHCHREGYESVALIPLVAGEENVGLLQLNDRRPDRFTPEVISFFEEIGNSIGIACTRMQAERESSESRRRLATLMSNLPGMAYRCANVSGWPMEFVSDGCSALTGYTAGELTSDDRVLFADLIEPEDRPKVWDVVQHAVSDGGSFVIEYRIRNKSGQVRWVWEKGEAVETDSEGTAILEGFITDTTERRLAENARMTMESQLRQSQKLESIGTLAGGVAHEINNPINGIMNYAQLIIDRLGEANPVAEFAAGIYEETERVAGIVSNLLSFARQEKQAQGEAGVHDIVNQTLSLVAAVLRHDQISTEVDLPTDLPAIRCRSQQIQQVLMNLITNARDALNEKYPGHDDNKKIILNAECGMRNAEGKWERLACGGSPPFPGSELCVRLTVKDLGPGMPAEVRERIFDPFYTTKPKDRGTGLGLSISHGIIKDHGGVLSVESEPGEWTRCCIDLPMWNVATGQEEQVASCSVRGENRHDDRR
jgi:PAS domain S-box-containing protein